MLPVYNEETVLPSMYAELVKVLNGLDVNWSVLFVNDGSRDGSVAILDSLFHRDPRVDYIVLSRNFGHQAALAAGLDHADGDIVITMDADLQHPPALIGALLDVWRQGYDIVHTRKLKTDALSPARRVTTRIAYDIIGRISQVRIIPHASDYRLLDRQAVEAVRSLAETRRLYRGLTSWVGLRQCVVPYVAEKRAAGDSQYGFRQLAGLFSRALFDYSDVPLYLGLVLGSVAACASALYLVFILIWLAAGRETPPGWASNTAVTLMLNSVSLAFSGIIGVYVARIYNEVRGRPSYLLSRVRRHAPRPDGDAR